MWEGTFEQEYDFQWSQEIWTTARNVTQLRMTTTVSCDKSIKRTHSKLDVKLNLVHKEGPHYDPNYEGWYFVPYDRDQEREEWEYLRFTSVDGELEVHHFCTDNAERSNFKTPGTPQQYKCNNRSPLGSLNYCCRSRTKDRKAKQCKNKKGK